MTGFVAVDYVQNLRFTGQASLRYMEISDAARKLRQFAKEEGIPVLLLSSITEAQDRNPNKRPNLSDLRGSGDLAFHAEWRFSFIESVAKTAPASTHDLNLWLQNSAEDAPV